MKVKVYVLGRILFFPLCPNGLLSTRNYALGS